MISELKPAKKADRFVRYCYRCGIRHEVYGALQSGSESSLTCSDACRSAVKRKRRDPVFFGIARAVAGLLEGERAPDPPPFWGLFVSLINRERAMIRAQKSAERLPGGTRDPRSL